MHSASGGENIRTQSPGLGQQPQVEGAGAPSSRRAQSQPSKSITLLGELPPPPVQTGAEVRLGGDIAQAVSLSRTRHADLDLEDSTHKTKVSTGDKGNSDSAGEKNSACRSTDKDDTHKTIGISLPE